MGAAPTSATGPGGAGVWAGAVAVVGLGYVGLPLARLMFDAGASVIGIDTDPAKVDDLRAGRCYLRHLGDGFVRPMSAAWGRAGEARFCATTDAAAVRHAEAVIVCVPTPLGGPGHETEPDLSYVEGTCRAISPHLRPGALVVLESTSYPGTTRRVAGPLLERWAGPGGQEHTRVCGQPGGFYLAFSPERVDPGRTDIGLGDVPKLVGGVDAQSGARAEALYRRAFARVVGVSSAEVAEAAKLLENVFRAVNIALVNEMKLVLEAMGIDVWEVIAAAATKPYGFMPFYPGPGWGGHCIPIDPFYLAYAARRAGVQSRFVELAGQINAQMPAVVVGAVAGALGVRGVGLGGARVLVLGLAYKPDIDDVRESPAHPIIDGLRRGGAAVWYHDPHVPRTHRQRRGDLGMESVALTARELAGYDAVVVVTAHRAIDWALVARHARLVIDTRDALRPWAQEMGDRLVRA
ncbi:MAG: nucleotide sugar dehydrogenase [Planctomyces sp.]|nr:nucleotide sugar dehydrogenase [Planctomyces sp.]